MLYQRRITIADGGWSIIQGSQQILLDVADICGVVPHTVHDISYMGTVQLHKAGLDHLSKRVIVPCNTDRLSCGAYGIYNQFRDLVQLFTSDLNQKVAP